MNVHDLIEKLDLTVVTGGYAGDLLSWVMGRAQQNDVWITIMSNLNTVAVAVLADVSAIILAEGVAMDEPALQRAQAEGVTILQSAKPTFQLAGETYALLKGSAS